MSEEKNIKPIPDKIKEKIYKQRVRGNRGYTGGYVINPTEIKFKLENRPGINIYSIYSINNLGYLILKKEYIMDGNYNLIKDHGYRNFVNTKTLINLYSIRNIIPELFKKYNIPKKSGKITAKVEIKIDYCEDISEPIKMICDTNQDQLDSINFALVSTRDLSYHLKNEKLKEDLNNICDEIPVNKVTLKYPAKKIISYEPDGKGGKKFVEYKRIDNGNTPKEIMEMIKKVSIKKNLTERFLNNCLLKNIISLEWLKKECGEINE